MHIQTIAVYTRICGVYAIISNTVNATTTVKFAKTLPAVACRRLVCKTIEYNNILYTCVCMRIILILTRGVCVCVCIVSSHTYTARVRKAYAQTDARGGGG